MRDLVLVHVGLILLTSAINFVCGVSFGRAAIRDEAITAGVAYYEVDPKTGETRFVFVKGEADAD